MKKLGVYVHIPFCRQKCQYCDFVSFSDFSMEEAYFAALNREISFYQKEMGEYSIDTIFFGGGTPSAVHPNLIAGIMEQLKNYDIDKNAEITMEANPATLTEESLSIYREAGINRLSIGLQSANNEELKKLGRIHSREDFLETYQLAREAGFGNINVDIMFGICGQTRKSFQETLSFVYHLAPEHISAYSLILEEGTPFFGRDDLNLPDEETERNMYETLLTQLDNNRYQQYEISNFSKEGYVCQHNLKYWRMKPFLGFGLAAHSFFMGERFANTWGLKEYIQLVEQGNKPLAFSEQECNQELFKDAIITGFRLNAGIDTKKLKELFEIDFDREYKEIIMKYLSSGHLKRTETGYALTKQGFEISNYILSDFI